MEQWSEVKAVEFWQPANDNIGAMSVVLDVVYKLRVECFNDWGGRGYDNSVPGDGTKTTPSGDGPT